MPHNNRMDSSSALKMTGIWKNTIKYDPYAPEGEAAFRDTVVENDAHALGSAPRVTTLTRSGHLPRKHTRPAV